MARALAVTVALAAAVSGCADHRISLDEFLALQEEMRQVPQAAVPATQPAVMAETASALLGQRLGPYKVGPGDVLLVTLTGGEPQVGIPPLQVRIDRKGEVELPIVGRVGVAERELEDVDKAIRDAYVPKVFSEVAVHAELISPEQTHVLVIGAVTTPGLINLRRTERNVLYAVVGAGGVSSAASGWATLKRLRRPGEAVTLNLFEPAGVQAALALDPLEDGDSITVDSAPPNTIYTIGLVNAPRPQVYAPGVAVTVLQAIAASGGLRMDITPTEATLIRRMPDGEDVHVRLDIERLKTGKDPNFTLAAGDILEVPYTLGTRLEEWVVRNVFFRAGVTTTANVNYNASAIEYMNDNARVQGEQGAYSGARTLQDQFDPFGFLMQPQTAVVQPAGP